MGIYSFLRKKLADVWGREIDQASWLSLPPQENPDDTESDSYYDLSRNPQVEAGMRFSDISHLFVSARGMKDEETGATFPPQLRYTTPELAGDEILDFVGWQFDEEFEGGFSEIIRSTDDVCKSYGHIPIEYEWYIRDNDPWKGKAFVRMAYARDPHKYFYDIDGKSGIYQKSGWGTYKLMNPQTFQSYSYNPLFNNPYGTSINLPLKPWIETFNKIWGYWRHALEKAGLGSWAASCPDAWFSKDEKSVAMRAAVEAQIKKIAAGTWSVFPSSMELQNHKLAIEAQAFLDWYTAFCEVVSLIYTGTTGALKEEEYGSRAAKESTDVREKSQRERFNAARVSNFWTWKFIPLLVSINFPPAQIRSTPALQLIPPNLQMPTTPEGQDTADEVSEKQDEKIEVKSKKEKKEEKKEEEEDPQEMMLAGELQEDGEEEKKPYTPPVPVPVSYNDFPRKEPLAPEYQDSIEFANNYLRHMPTKNYKDIQPGESHQVFTVKRLRSMDVSGEDETNLLNDLKWAIIPTLAQSESDAWSSYWTDAVSIFRAYGIVNPSPQLRSDLIISFRQARQNALNEGLYQSALDDSGVVGLRIILNPNVKQHHFSHKLWGGIALPKEHEELRLGGKLRIPMDFGCVCSYQKVYDLAELTPERDYPQIYPGASYRFYV